MRFQKAALLSKKVKRNTENKYYNLQEIKIIFQNCRTKNIDEVEFHLFCDELKVLPRDVVNRISKEIKFVLLSANPKRINPACLLDIGREIKPNTKAIVILTPIYLVRLI